MHSFFQSLRVIIFGMLSGILLALALFNTLALSSWPSINPAIPVITSSGGFLMTEFEKILVDTSTTTDGKVQQTKNLDGLPLSSYQKRITGACGVANPIVEIKNDGTVVCLAKVTVDTCATAPDITLPNGQIWQACNIGATSNNPVDVSSYGNYYQWGRNNTGFTLPSKGLAGFDWQDHNDNAWGDTTNTEVARQGPCTVGYHIPTKNEWALVNTQVLVNTLKLPKAGGKYYAGLPPYTGPVALNQGNFGNYWSSTPYPGSPGYFDAAYNFDNSGALINGNGRAVAFPIRCIKNTTLMGTCGTGARAYAWMENGYGATPQCSLGLPSNTNFPAWGGTENWVCTTVDGDSPTCTATRSIPYDGICGTANGMTFPDAQTNVNPYTLCLNGGPSQSVFPAGSLMIWSCRATMAGFQDAPCQANRASATQVGACDNSLFLGCSVGNPINDNSQVACGTTRSWNCQGTGGTSPLCSRGNPACAGGNCGVTNESWGTGCSADAPSGQSIINNGTAGPFTIPNTAPGYTGSASFLCWDSEPTAIITAEWAAMNISCSPVAPVPQVGVCNNSVALGCSTGGPINDNLQTSCNNTRRWNCSGVNGGSDSPQCSIYNGACSAVPQVGVCNNSVALGCSTGGPINDNLQTSCNNTRRWNCSGVNGGSDSPQCSIYNGACSAVPQVGVCNNSVALGCSTGGPINDNLQTSCNNTRRWNCSGVNGGSDSPQCSIYNGACSAVPQVGVCNNSVALGCSTGGPINDNLQTSCNNTRRWNCSGVNGGSDSPQCSIYNGACSCSSVPSAPQPIACSHPSVQAIVPGKTVGTAYYRTETAACTGNVGQLLPAYNDTSGCSVPVVCSSVPSAPQPIACSHPSVQAIVPGKTVGTAYYRTETAACTGNVGQLLPAYNDTSGCSIPVPVVNGSCGSEYHCITGIPQNLSHPLGSLPSRATVTWNCVGSGPGHSDAPCSEMTGQVKDPYGPSYSCATPGKVVRTLGSGCFYSEDLIHPYGGNCYEAYCD